jgi:hypothetical protein
MNHNQYIFNIHFLYLYRPILMLYSNYILPLTNDVVVFWIYMNFEWHTILEDGQKNAETYRNYLYIWTSGISWKYNYLYACVFVCVCVWVCVCVCVCVKHRKYKILKCRLKFEHLNVKQFLYRTEESLRVSGGWDFQISRQSAHEGGKTAFAPRKYSS